MPELLQGALLDQRTEDEKLFDFTFEEIVASANPVTWKEKHPSEWRKFPIFNQDGSGSCVAQSAAKELGIMHMLNNPEDGYIHFSATHIYQRRYNKPTGGMALIDSRKILKNGVTLEQFVPSQNMNDKQMDSATIKPFEEEIGKLFAVPNYVTMRTGNIETVASIIETTGKGVMVWFYFTYDEWTEHPYVKNPNLNLNGIDTCRHAVVAVDYCLVGGKKCLIIEDSWGTSYGKAGQRIIDEDFFRDRNWVASYLVNFKYNDQTSPEPQPAPNPNKPKHTFTKVLEFGQTNNDIVKLQDILKYEGLFPVNTQSTGYYGAVTARAVLAFQRKHTVAQESELIGLQGRRVGVKTVEKLNQLYS